MAVFPLPLPESAPRIDAVAFAGEGATVAACSANQLAIASIDLSHEPRVLPMPVEPNDVAWGLAFSPSGDRVAVVFREGGVLIVDVSSGDAARLPSRWQHQSVAWSPDGSHVAAGQLETWVSVFDVDARSERCVLDADIFDDEGSNTVVFAGATLISTAFNRVCVWPFDRVRDKKLKVREVGTLENVAVLKPKRLGRDGYRHILGLALAPDATQLALIENVEGKRAISRLDLATGKSIGRALPVACIHMVWTGEPNVVAIFDDESGSIQLVDLNARRLLERSFDDGEPLSVNMLASHPSTRRLAAATSTGLRVWEL